MSSLHSLLRKGRLVRPVPREHMTEAEYDAIVDELLIQARVPGCVLVNAQSVAIDLVDPREQWRHMAETFHKIPSVTPPFPMMWIEFNLGRRFAVQIVRQTLDRGHRVSAYVWEEEDGSIGAPMFRSVFPVDESGSIDRNSCESTIMGKVAGDEEAVAIGLVQSWFAIGCALHTLSRMNCRNVELRPITEGKLRPHPPNKVVPASVWHEIVITSVPKVRSTGQDIFEHEESEIRLHWVRGHYADYRKGNGLFGRIKGLFWIPEHRRGNEELGQVIPEYTVQ